MWRNADVLDFVGWLRAHNERNPARGAGFFGLDLYSLYRSIDAVIRYLDSVDVAAGLRARRRYACLEQFQESEASDRRGSDRRHTTRRKLGFATSLTRLRERSTQAVARGGKSSVVSDRRFIPSRPSAAPPSPRSTSAGRTETAP